MIDVDQVLDEPTQPVRRKREADAYSLPRCSCTRQHSCPMHARVLTPTQRAKLGPVERTHSGEPLSAARLR